MPRAPAGRGAGLMALYRRKQERVEAVRVVKMETNAEGDPAESCFSEFPAWLSERVRDGTVGIVMLTAGGGRIRVEDEREGLAEWVQEGNFIVCRGGLMEPVLAGRFLEEHEEVPAGGQVRA